MAAVKAKKGASCDDEPPNKDRKPHHATAATRKLVKTLASSKLARQKEIAEYLDIDEKTLRKHYRDELDTPTFTRHAKVVDFLFKMASGEALDKKDGIPGAKPKDCVLAAIFYAKTQMGWKESDGDDEEKGATITMNFHKGMKPSGN